MARGEFRQPFCQRVVKRPRALAGIRLPGQPLPPEKRKVVDRQRHRMVDARALRGQRFQPAGRFTFPGLGFNTQRAGDRIKQATTGRGLRRVDAAPDRRCQQRPVFTLNRARFRVLLPVRDKRQAVGEQIAPRLPRRQIAPRQRNGINCKL